VLQRSVTLPGTETDDVVLRDAGHVELIMASGGGAHIFPLAYEGHWKEHDYGSWITTSLATESADWMLLTSTVRQHFDGYDVAINPDARMPYHHHEVHRLILVSGQLQDCLLWR
jgi:hypothetical protein